MHEDKYQNHFLNIVASREAMLQFAQYTATAAAGTDNAAIQALAPALQAQVSALGKTVTERGTQQGEGQSGTRTQNDIIAEMKQFARDTNADLLQPKLRKQPAELAKVLPYGLSALTAANKQDFPVRFAVFAEALAAQAAVIGPEAGQQARAYVAELAAATAARDAADKREGDTIGALGEDWRALCAGLWQVHCTALGQFHDSPGKARAFFNYDLLPNKNPGRTAQRRTPGAAEA